MEKYFISLFILLFIAEVIVSIKTKNKSYHLKNTLENIGIGAVSMFIDYGFSLLSYPLLLFLFSNYRLIHLQRSGYYFILLFISLDFLEYWFHRLSHEIPIMWTAHKVHHQSEFFNLSVGLRTSFLIPLFNVGFYCILPLIGFHPADILVLIFLQGIYQLFIHTKLIGKLGWLDKILVTPSVHRVHHGKNEIYLDKNYGKVLTLWDWVFNTYKKETEDVIYGATDSDLENGVIKSQLVPIKKWWVKKKRK